ncbi:MAG: hypothetical protein MRZ79_27050 [Bacteroidia bacterium]|nr:hypothetical protein [Bacteroidia bacterium]
MTNENFSNNSHRIQSLGVLKFSKEGILFAGDSLSGAIHAFDLRAESGSKEPFEINVYAIDVQIAAVLGTSQAHVQINDIAVHPISGEVYLSITRGHGVEALPALVKVDAAAQIQNIDLSVLEVTSQTLNKVPENTHYFALRGVAGAPPTKKDIAKSKLPVRTLSIVAMEYHQGELFVSGISNEEFSSVIRRLPYPFNGTESISQIEMYHIVHDNFESRAPIRSMVVKKIDGVEQLVAAYTCSPLVLIPLDELQDEAKVSARTIGDMGNGQPIDMVPFSLNGEEMLFVTNNSRSPLVIPVGGLNNAKVVTNHDFERGGKVDLHPLMPFGPIGKSIMFTGASLRIDLLNEKQFVSLNRDAETGSLDLETIFTKFPFSMHNIIGEFDIPRPNQA